LAHGKRRQVCWYLKRGGRAKKVERPWKGRVLRTRKDNKKKGGGMKRMI